jgi:hypothetical protein
MVAHPSEYPWSSYAVNALGADDERALLVPHSEYLLLDADAGKRQVAYRSLFKTRKRSTARSMGSDSIDLSFLANLPLRICQPLPAENVGNFRKVFDVAAGLTNQHKQLYFHI